jgi:hypothetical protein
LYFLFQSNYVCTQIGFEMIDAIAEAEGISVNSKQFKAKVGKGNHMLCLWITCVHH